MVEASEPWEAPAGTRTARSPRGIRSSREAPEMVPICKVPRAELAAIPAAFLFREFIGSRRRVCKGYARESVPSGRKDVCHMIY